jgi:heptaprenylglyceryl phosphate synthase
MNEISDLNWKLAMNGGTPTSSGTGATKLTTYVPPLVGAEVRVMLAFVDNLDTEAIVWPQVFNVGSVEYVRGTYETKAGLSVEFNAEIPATGYVTPYQRFTAGALSLAP